LAGEEGQLVLMYLPPIGFRARCGISTHRQPGRVTALAAHFAYVDMN
jgi:hypothetical protein